MSDTLQAIIDELRLSLGKTETTLNSINEGLAWTDAQGVVTWCNAAFAALVGEPQISLLGQPVWRTLALEEHGQAVGQKGHPAQRALTEKASVSGYYRLAKGRLAVEVDVTHLRLPRAGESVIVTVRDVSQARELEQTRLQSAALAASANAIVIADRQGRVNWANRAFTETSGFSLEEARNLTLDQLSAADEPEGAPAAWWRTVKAGHHWSGRLDSRRKDGSTYPEEQTITPVRDFQGDIGHYVVIKRDLSDQVRLEEQLERSHRMMAAVYEAHRGFVSQREPREVFQQLLERMLEFTGSAFGFIGEIHSTVDQQLFLRTHAITDLSWNAETRRYYDDNVSRGLEFYNLKTLFGAVISNGRALISNDPAHHPHAGGIPPGHPPLTAFMGAPLWGTEGLVGMVALANRPGGYDNELLNQWEPFFSTAASFIQNLRDQRRRKETQRALKSSQARLKAILDTAADGIMTIDSRGTIHSVNRAVARIFGYGSAELVGQNVSMLMPQPHRSQHDQYLQRYLGGGAPQIIGVGRQVEGVRKDGSLVPLDLAVSEVEMEGGDRLFTGILRDVSERQRYEDRLRLFQAAVEQAQEAIMITNAQIEPLDLRIIYVNPGFTAITGYTAEEVVGQSPRILQGPLTDAQVLSGLRRALATGQTYRAETINYRKDGTTFYNEWHCAPIRDPHGKVVNYLAVQRDVSQRRQDDESLRNLVAGTASVTGQDYFPALVRHLAQAVGVKHALVGELLPGEPHRVKALAFWSHGRYVQDFSYKMEHAPCRLVYEDGPLTISDGVGERFPRNLDLANLGLRSYMGVPLLDRQGVAVGHIFVADNKPMDNWERLGSILSIFASRAAVELERQRDRQELVRSQERLDLALRGADLGLWDWDLRTGQVYLNPRLTEMLGYSADQFSAGEDFREKLAHPDDLADMRWALVAYLEGDSEVYDTEYRLRHQDGHWLWVNERGRVVARDEEDRPVRMSGTVLDINDRKRAEQALMAARAREVSVGERIQATLLLGQPPTDLWGITVGALTQASQGIDGDFYDFLVHDERTLDIMVGDVMGKGVPAALMGAGAKSQFLRSFGTLLALSCGGDPPSPEEIMRHAGVAISRELMKLDSFITMLYARINLHSRTFCFVDCGHTHVLHMRLGEAEPRFLKGDNMPLGFVVDQIYETRQVPVLPGDMFVIFSDGVTEADDPAGELFGEERLGRVVAQEAWRPPQELAAHIRDQVIAFSQNEHLRDDLTCLCLRVGEGPGPKALAWSETVYPSRLEHLADLRAQVRRFLEGLEGVAMDEDLVGMWELALTEAATNVMKHAYDRRQDQPVFLTMAHYPDQLRVCLSHWGRGFDREAVPDPVLDGSQDGGYGLMIIEQLMDRTHYGQDQWGRHQLALEKDI